MQTGQQSTETGWHPEQIKAAIRMRGVSLTELAERNGYAGAAVRVALRRPWPGVERVIAKFLGVQPMALWPDRYDSNGVARSVPRRNVRKCTRPRRALHSVRRSEARHA